MGSEGRIAGGLGGVAHSGLSAPVPSSLDVNERRPEPSTASSTMICVATDSEVLYRS